ncbi:hypothetical protein JXB02_00100 [Candidatus Woesearchaeota archaeon]|nr:hypothetical protein [Candidatus Woesearchaeota archaeon]
MPIAKPSPAKKPGAAPKKKEGAKTKAPSLAKRKKRLSMNVEPDKFFIMADGRVIKNVKELALAMDDMAEDIFRHHVNEARHDFANWVRDVIGELELAERMVHERGIRETQRAILKHMVDVLTRG